MYCYFCKMIKKFTPKFLIFIAIVLQFFVVKAQNSTVKVTINTDNLQTGKVLSIIVNIQNSDDYNCSEFPEIKGAIKATKAIKHNFITQNSKKIKQHAIIQDYVVNEKAKTIVVPKHEFIINEKNVELEGKTIVIKKDKSEIELNHEIEDLDLTLEVNKSKIYLGEGFKVSLALYLSDKTTTSFQFPENISSQIESLARKIKPKDCLESRRVISNIIGKKVTINDKGYTYFNLFEAVYYPLNANNIYFESLVFNMKKQKGNSSEDYPLKTIGKSISVIQLPDHPLKEKLSIGIYKLEETLQNKNQYTGESFEYKFKIVGEGNFKTLNIEKLGNYPEFDFFQTFQSVSQSLGSESGSKSYTFKVLPKDSGSYNFSNYFYFIYFNTLLGNYDTLSSKKNIVVLGESMRTSESLIKDIFYDISNLRTDTTDFNIKKTAIFIANFIVILLMIVLVFLYKNNNK